jgi:hypothetical protein
MFPLHPIVVEEGVGAVKPHPDLKKWFSKLREPMKEA